MNGLTMSAKPLWVFEAHLVLSSLELLNQYYYLTTLIYSGVFFQTKPRSFFFPAQALLDDTRLKVLKRILP